MTDISFSKKADFISYQYLINNEKINKMKENKQGTTNLSLKDKKFYKKRFINLTKELYKGNIKNSPLQRVFNSYLEESIKHFQFQDISDSLQEEYDTISSCNKDNSKSNFNYNIDNDNNLIARKTHLNNSLDDFVIKKNQKKKINIFPEKKKINLYEKKLKKKGLKKKKKKANE